MPVRRVARALVDFFPCGLRSAWRIYHVCSLMGGYDAGVPHTSGLRVGVLGGWMPKELKRYYGRGHLHVLTLG